MGHIFTYIYKTKFLLNKRKYPSSDILPFYIIDQSALVLKKFKNSFPVKY